MDEFNVGMKLSEVVSHMFDFSRVLRKLKKN